MWLVSGPGLVKWRLFLFRVCGDCPPPLFYPPFFPQVFFYSFPSACSINIPLVFQDLFWSRAGCSSCFFPLWTVISFSSSLMIFSFLGLETCVCGFICLLCVVFPSFFVWCCCCCWCVPSRVFLPLVSRPFFLHTSSHTPLLCLSVRFCDVTPSPLTPPPRRHGLPQSDKLRSVLSSALLFSSSSTPRPSSSLFVALPLRNNSPKNENWFIV